MTTYCLDEMHNIWITRQPNGDWHNTEFASPITAGSYTANFYERIAAEVENERRHEAARLAVIRCHERNMREIAQISAKREWVEVMITPLYSEIPF